MKNKIIFGLLIYLSVAAKAQFVCQDIFVSSLQKRQSIAQTLVQSQVAAIAKPTEHGAIPVILGNVKNFDSLKSLYEKSIGIIVQHQPDYNNDHGMYRLGLNYIDMDAPGYRQRGELYKTGLSWVSLKEYLQYSYKKSSSVRIEVLYKLNDFDYNTAYAYQAMRRAAIVRAPFTFGGGRTNMKLPNMMAQGGEHCFSFCSGTSLGAQINEMSNQLRTDGFMNVEKLMEDQEVKNYLAQAQSALLQADPNNANQLNANIGINIQVPSAIANNATFINGSGTKKTEILNWIIGYKLSTDYRALLMKLGVYGGSAFEGIHSAEASAIVIYDGAQTNDSFQTTNYVSKGIFSTWTQKDAQNIKSILTAP